MTCFTHNHASRLRRYLAGPRFSYTVLWSSEGLTVKVARPGEHSCRSVEIVVHDGVVAVTEGERVLGHVPLGYGWIRKVANTIAWDNHLKLWLLQQELDDAWRDVVGLVEEIGGTLHEMCWVVESEAVEDFEGTLDGFGHSIGEIDGYIERALISEPAETVPVASSVSPRPIPSMTTIAEA